MSDTGPGIPERDLPRVFDPFWQARATAGLGTGLGLFIVKGIVNAHGGEVWVESTPGEGTTFSFTVPKAATRPEEDPAPDSRPSAEHTPTVRGGA